jgi:uncharacterized protein
MSMTLEHSPITTNLREKELSPSLDPPHSLASYSFGDIRPTSISTKTAVPSSPLSLSERVVAFLEGPWAPSKENLPDQRTPEECGNSAAPFRKAWHNERLRHATKRELKAITSSCVRTSLTPWTSLYEYSVSLKPEHAHLSGMRILHLSDIHLLENYSKPTEELEAITTYVKSLSTPFDLCVLTGDLITKTPNDISPGAIKSLKELTSCCQHSSFVPGNHDYHGHDIEFINSTVERVGFYDINNSVVELRRRNDPFTIIGVDDAYFGTPKAPDELPDDQFNMVLTHNLDAIRANFPQSVDLILSGHTHWGECCLFNGARLMKLWGYSDNVNNHTQGWDYLSERTLSYVHPGLARYYVPYRGLRHPPGFTIINLR